MHKIDQSRLNQIQVHDCSTVSFLFTLIHFPSQLKLEMEIANFSLQLSPVSVITRMILILTYKPAVPS